MGRARVFVVLMVVLSPFMVLSQYANSWINFTQPYFKIPVAQNGIYRLTYSALQAAGFPVNSVDPRFIQLFHRGQEQSIYVRGQKNGIFDASDFIEFYGQKNDGTLDSLLYRPPSNQPHKYYNLYSDTTAYFLTFNSFATRGLRMDSTQFVNVNNLPPESYQNAQRLIINHSNYSGGYTFNSLTESTYFDQGEGWTGTFLQQGLSVDYVVDSVYNGVTTAGNPRLEVLLVGLYSETHALQVYVGPNSGSLRLLQSLTFSGYETFKLDSALNWSDIGPDGKVDVRIVALSAGDNNYQASVSYVKLTFPQNFDFTGLTNKALQLAVNPLGQSYLAINNPASGMRLWDISNMQSVNQILPIFSGGTFTAVVPGTSTAKTLYASSEFITPSIVPVSFRPLNSYSSNFLIITNKVLRSPVAGSDQVQAYAAYRASTAGGSYDTLIVNIDQLYNQFNYGEVSPLAIYSFMNFMAAQGNIRYLFFIGKGRDITYSAYQRLPVPATELRDLVPSAGYPGGDIAYTAGLYGTSYQPGVPTGRLTATTPAQVAAYLSKVKELESQPLQPWSKQLLHLSGGGSSVTDAFELALFRQYVDGFAQIAEGPYLGGHVTTESKQNVGVQQINVAPVVNQGVNLVTFFGHSSSSTIDIDIGNVTDPTLGYNNQGKYPVFLINGCNAGTIFANEVTFGENWMLAANLGSRNFIAGTSFGYSNELQQYSTLFYQVGFGDSTFIKKGIGDIQQEVGRRYLNSNGTDITAITTVQQMVLAGDPALKLFGTALPDYSIDNGSLSLTSLDGKTITSLSDSFAIRIIVKNLGATNSTPIKVRVIRTFSDNTTQTYDSTFTSVLYIDTLTYKLHKDISVNGSGNNLFTVIIDPLNTINEISKTNNTATLSAFIPSNGTINLYPLNFGIVNVPSLNLLFQDANLLGEQRNFLVQFDTTINFNSAFAVNQTVSGKVLAKKAVNLLPGDSVVYYWRTKPVGQSAGDSSNWTVSSFIFINSSPEGWAQAKFPQLESDVLTNLNFDFASKKLSYLQTISSIEIKSIGANSSSPYTAASMQVNGTEYDVSVQVPCRNNTINLVAFNKTAATPYPGISIYDNDARGCGLQPSVINSFDSTEVYTGAGNDILQYVANVNFGDSVVLFSVGKAGFSSWPPSVLGALNLLGISNGQITSLQDGEPVVVFAKKGAAVGSAKFYLPTTSPATSQDVTVAATITGRNSSGNVQSTTIGPAKNWVRFTQQTTNVESVDQVSYSIYGVTSTGQETLLQSNVAGGSTDLSSINPVLYPMLKVQLNMQDTVNLTAVQLRHWFVLYESVADGLLFYEGPSATQTVQEGQPFTGQYGFTNISSNSFTDSLQVNSEVINTSKATRDTSVFKINAPAPGDTTTFSLTVNTKGKAGLNDINVYVNPRIQPEQNYDNNTISLVGYLNVLADLSDPVLDVTVDGRYLQNGDFVSPSPVIHVKLQDDNPFLMITDTTHLNMFLSFPCDTTPCPFTRINFSRPDVKWTPETISSGFAAVFHPANLPEGKYSLQVNGTDASGNPSGTQPYEISFQVRDETTLALQSVYPNPSNDLFNFSFILSGNVLPENFSLQIYSSDGRSLQQFGMSDVSNFIIGTNILPWSSVQSGLVSGIYFYQLGITVNGKTVNQTGMLVLAK
jgi:hypothetical protein